ncbi:MAG: metal-dependent transcriptional regulator [Armatimonadota bacterium]|nr:metal-dependent transcriptional regulator [Armatimonadota bacterium]MDR7401666.1 metal-dependent transcriptional regulator [Armatimonadota bacterium]MDR7437780.1 metal-dependent transcriptional regulator [Armatimonadota bacterium]MDR7471296.1 metal-dependent transcriptional regulator [Armatimonadota bacterium]MDR7506897.1 metal-dependent transcriptional regulator [Armatimonadota bacterium]
MLTQAVQDYLKAIYKMRRDGEVTTCDLARRLRVAPASATLMVKKLARLGLVEHTPYRGVRLTPGGERAALEVIRHHRLLELLLARLGVALDRVDAEAERLEHAISEELEEHIARSLGEPTHDPHGDPIPTREGALRDEHHPLLADLAAGRRGVVARVSDRDPAILRSLAQQGLLPGAAVRVEKVDADGWVEVRVGRARARVGPEQARAVYVMAAPPRPAVPAGS